MEQVTASIQLHPGREKPVLNRHPWVFSGAISRVEGDPAPGDLVNLVDRRGQFLGTGYYNPHSQIRVRILSWNDALVIDEDFWRERLLRAFEARERLPLAGSDAYRLVHAEADGLPGLIVDRYGEYYVVQCLTLGIDHRKEMLFRLLAELRQPRGIVERSDVSVRAKEKLTEVAGVRLGEAPPDGLVVTENGRQFGVNLLEGHKTGLYLDQRENRSIVCQPEHIAGKELLNVFAYTGGFAVYAADNGATAITNIDSSADLLVEAEKNVQRNQPERAAEADEYIAGDAFQVLRYYRDSGRLFDAVILDPPKFAHSKADLRAASRGYKDLNWLALRILRPGGLLATFSCSGLISADLFQKIVFGASVDAGRDVQILQPLSQAADHPILLSFPESAYLKGLLCRVW